MKFAAILVAAAAFTLAVPASAQFAKPEDAVKYRQSVMFVMAQHFGRVGAMANGRAPYDAKAAADNAEIAAEMSRLPWPGFAASTKDITTNTKAKPEIWAEQAKFREHGDKMQAEMQKLATAAKSGSLDTLKAQFGPTAQTCKACHDNYRNQ
jgi:cytochrome c556